jgi:hypothetical protein
VLIGAAACYRHNRRKGKLRMDRISRRQIIRGGTAAAAAMTLGAPSVHAQKSRQTLR